jgi:transposase InsO family protein
MRTHGLRGVRRAKTFVTTRPDPVAVRPPDLVKRNFRAKKPNELWVVDFTYLPTWAGTVFSAFVTDVLSRRIVGWCTKATMPTELPLDALEMALWTREQANELVAGLVHHSDAGTRYTSIRYGHRVADAGAVASIGTVGDSYDNAMAESVIGLYKTECVRHEGSWRAVDDLELATLTGSGGSTRSASTARSATSHPSNTRTTTTATSAPNRTRDWENRASTKPAALQRVRNAAGRRRAGAHQGASRSRNCWTTARTVTTSVVLPSAATS